MFHGASTAGILHKVRIASHPEVQRTLVIFALATIGLAAGNPANQSSDNSLTAKVKRPNAPHVHSAQQISFGTVTMGTTSAVPNVTLTNTDKDPVAVWSRINRDERFGFFCKNTCGVHVEPGAKCTISGMFRLPT